MAAKPVPNYQELRKKLAAATKGTWQNCTLETGDCGDPLCTGIYIDGQGWSFRDTPEEARANAELIVAAVNALPDLLDSLQSTRAALERVEDERDAAHKRYSRLKSDTEALRRNWLTPEEFLKRAASREDA